MSKSDFLEAALLNGTLGGGTWAKPATVYMALFTVAQNDAGTGGTEVPSTNAYARVSITNNVTNFPNATGTAPTTKSNGVVITFPQATPAGWGTIVGWGLYDAATAGNLLYHGAVSPSKAVAALDTAEFSIGSLTITED